MDVEKILETWSEPKTFSELPYRHLMPECMVTMDDKVGEEKGLDKLINEARRKVKSMTDKIRKSIDMER